MRVAPIGTDPQDQGPLSGFHRPLEGTRQAQAKRFLRRGLVPDSLMPLTGSAARPARTLRLSPLVSLTAGEVMAGESMSEALARTRPRQEQR
jgi:hypothetical protein